MRRGEVDGVDYWIADAARGLAVVPSAKNAPDCPSPEALCAYRGRVWCACGAKGALFDAGTRRALRECPFPPAVVRMEALPGALYALSGDADSVSRLCPETGQLRLCASAGCYPRDMCLSPCGRMLAVAAGTEGALLVMDCETLDEYRRIPVPGVASSVCFFSGGLAALCAAGDQELQTLLYTVSARGVVRERLTLPGPPGALCALPDGGLCVGGQGTLLRWYPDGRSAMLAPCLLPVRARPVKGGVLVADIMAGRALRVPLSAHERAQCLYTGREIVDIVQIESAVQPTG